MKVSPWDVIKIWWHVRKVKRVTDRHLGPQDFLEASFAVNAQEGDVENAGYYYVVGAMAVNWASIELHLDVCNTFLIQSRKTNATRAPQSLGPKLDLFEDAFRTHPSLSIFSERAAEIVDEVNRLRTIRHDIIHGIVLGKLDSGERRFHRFTFNRNIGESQISNYTFEQILNHFHEMLSLRGRTQAFTGEFVAFIHSDDLQNPSS